MEHSTYSTSRRLSLESTATSEFEVISGDGSSRGSTMRGSDSDDSPVEYRARSPSTSLHVPSLYSRSVRSDQESIFDESNIKPTVLQYSKDLTPLSLSDSTMSGSCCSSTAIVDSETAGVFEQKTVQRDDEWQTKMEQLLERNIMLEKSLIASKTQENQQAKEIEQLQKENVELSRQVRTLQEGSTKLSSTSCYHRLIVVGFIAAVVALYIDVYGQLLNERRNIDSLREVLQQMSNVVEKLEMKHQAEYKQLLEESTKQIADDMNFDISLARKERELEHERLIEAYREKMLLYKDLDELRKEKHHGKRRSSFNFF